MATAYYYAAHFNKPMIHPPACNAQSGALDLQPKNEATTHNASIPSSPRHFVPAGFVAGQQESIFFRLPAELRNEVYKELLCPSTPKLKELAQSVHHTSTTPTAVYPAILSTCRKIHEEAADLLYTTHVFHAHSSLLTSLPHLTSSANPIVCPSVLAKIKRWQLTIRLDTDPRFTMAQATAAFSGAEYLEIRVWQSMFDACDSTVLGLFMCVRGVKVARVHGSTNPELASWLEDRMMAPIEKSDARCCKEVSVGSEWFGGRDVWTFGNR